MSLVEASGLTGRGGAEFPTGEKLRSVAAQRRRPVVLIDAAEGEPASRKDRALLGALPQLVLDGAVLTANALGAKDIVVGVAAHARGLRRSAMSICSIAISGWPAHYLRTPLMCQPRA